MLDLAIELGDLWPDQEAQVILVSGVPSMAYSTILVCKVSAPHQRARRNAAKLEAEFRKEHDQGLSRVPVRSPPFWPIRSCPPQAILKADGVRLRELRNSSWPSLDVENGFLGGLPLRANANFDLRRADDFETISAGAIIQSAAALLEARRFVDAGEWDTIVVDRIWDLGNYLRMLSLA